MGTKTAIGRGRLLFGRASIAGRTNPFRDNWTVIGVVHSCGRVLPEQMTCVPEGGGQVRGHWLRVSLTCSPKPFSSCGISTTWLPAIPGSRAGMIDGAERRLAFWSENAWILAASELEVAGCGAEGCNVGNGEKSGPLSSGCIGYPRKGLTGGRWFGGTLRNVSDRSMMTLVWRCTTPGS